MMAFRCLRRCLRRSLSSLKDDEGGACGHELPTATDRNPSAFATSCLLSAVSSKFVLMNCATKRVNREDAMVRSINASMNDFDCVQRSML